MLLLNDVVIYSVKDFGLLHFKRWITPVGKVGNNLNKRKKEKTRPCYEQLCVYLQIHRGEFQYVIYLEMKESLDFFRANMGKT